MAGAIDSREQLHHGAAIRRRHRGFPAIPHGAQKTTNLQRVVVTCRVYRVTCANGKLCGQGSSADLNFPFGDDSPGALAKRYASGRTYRHLIIRVSNSARIVGDNQPMFE